MKVKRIVLVSILLVVGLILGTFGCSGTTPTPTQSPSPTVTTSPTATPTTSPSPTALLSPTQAQVIKWKGQNSFTAGAAVGKIPMTGNGTWGYQWVDWVKQATGGRLVIDLAQPNAIVPVADSYTAVQQGALDVVAPIYPAYYAGLLPESNVEAFVPFAIQSFEEEWALINYYGWGKLLHDIYAKNGIYHIALSAGTYGSAVGTTFEVTSLDSFKNKKFRAAGSSVDIIKAYGGIPTTIPFTETYMALKLGTVDGYYGSFSQLEDQKLKEVITNVVVNPNAGYVFHNIMINQKSWDALPADIQQLLARDTQKIVLGGQLEGIAADKYLVANMPQVKFISLSEADKATVIGNAVRDSWPVIAAASPDSKKLMDMLIQLNKDYGRIPK